MNLLPPLRIPRMLLDPRDGRLPQGDGDGLVSVVLEIEAGRIQALHPAPEPPDASAMGRDAQGPAPPGPPLALTPLVEPHAHLDKAFSAARFPNRAGTIAAALAANQAETSCRTAEDLEQRAERALLRAWRQGLRAIRSHVDCGGERGDLSLEVLEGLRRRWADRLELQLVGLVPIQHWGTPQGRSQARWLAERGGRLGGVIGGPLGNGSGDGDAVLETLRLADQLGCGVDLHLDEGVSHRGRGVRLVCEALERQRLQVPVVCSHACSMALLPPRACQRLVDRMARLALGVVALPSTNLWLLDRRAEATPTRRAQAPIRQLQNSGVVVAVGGDNVQDAWFPGGDFDPLEVLRFAVVASHLHPWSRQGLSPFSTAAAQLLQLEWDGILRPGSPADLVVLDAHNWSDLLARSPQRRVMRGGVWLPKPEREEPAAQLRGWGEWSA